MVDSLSLRAVAQMMADKETQPVVVTGFKVPASLWTGPAQSAVSPCVRYSPTPPSSRRAWSQ